MSRRSLGELLVESSIISPAELEEALRRQRTTGRRLGVELREMGLCTSEDVEWALSAQFNLPFVRLTPGHVDPQAARLVPEELARRTLLVPTWVVGHTLHVVLADPTNREIVERIGDLAGKKVQVSLGLPSEIRRAIDEAYHPGEGMQSAVRLYESHLLNADEEVEINRDSSGRRFLETLLRNAVRVGATGVLFEISGHEARVRMRMRTGEGWTTAAHSRPDWLSGPLDRLELVTAHGAAGAIPAGTMELPGESDSDPMAFSVRSWRLP